MPRGGKRPGAGKPRKLAPQDVRSINVTVRVTPAERALLGELLDAGLTTYDVLRAGIEATRRPTR